MKQLLVLSIMFFFSTQIMAVKPVHAIDVSEEATENVQVLNIDKNVVHDGGIFSKLLKKNKTLSKMANWVQTKVLNKALNTSDPVNKWLYFAIVLALGSIVLGIIVPWNRGISLLVSLLSLAAAVCFVYWLLLIIDAI